MTEAELGTRPDPPESKEEESEETQGQVEGEDNEGKKEKEPVIKSTKKHGHRGFIWSK
jgi:hypothetical protein